MKTPWPVPTLPETFCATAASKYHAFSESRLYEAGFFVAKDQAMQNAKLSFNLTDSMLWGF